MNKIDKEVLERAAEVFYEQIVPPSLKKGWVSLSDGAKVFYRSGAEAVLLAAIRHSTPPVSGENYAQIRTEKSR